MMIEKPTLLIMAAGTGNRYGGLKQIDPVGPARETLMDYSVFDAIRAGFGRLVCVIRRDIEEPFRRAIGARFDQRLPVEYVFQELHDLPDGFSVPPGRKKPWGTGQAILAAADVIAEPFAAINADDFYGCHSFKLLADHLRSGERDHAMVGFVLRSTLSDHGSVTRGICRVGADRLLQDVTEVSNIRKDGEGATFTGDRGVVHHLGGDETVSMSMWGFMPSLFPLLREQWIEFLRQQSANGDAEFTIPAAVGALVASGRARCQVLTTSNAWFGVTHAADRPIVVENIRRLVERRTYPDPLWT